jgi:type II secretory pathway component PulF
MSRGLKIFTGFLSIVPLLLVAGLFIFMFSQFSRIFDWQNTGPEPADVFNLIGPMLIAEGIVFLFALALLIYFIVHLSRNKGMDSTEKAIWVLALVLGNVTCYPIYWYMKILKGDDSKP